MSKIRLDVALFERGLCPSRERARTTIMSGVVYVDGQKAEKPGTEIRETSEIEVRENPLAYVSRGGLKLEKALDTFGIDVTGLHVIDAGASTGGFTDCLLQRGAAHVWAVDVGYGQLAWAIRNDPRVTCMERTNIRLMTPDMLGRAADMAVMDLSFISLSLVLPVIKSMTVPGGNVVCLVKPQFEAGREKVGKKGVIRDPEVHIEVLRRFCAQSGELDMPVKEITFSPIKGPTGNIEFLAHLVSAGAPGDVDIEKLVCEAHEELKAK